MYTDRLSSSKVGSRRRNSASNQVGTVTHGLYAFAMYARNESLDLDVEKLNTKQQIARKLLLHPLFQLAMDSAICVHMVVAVQQTNQRAMNQGNTLWQDICEKSFMTLYVIDLTMRVVLLRSSFFSSWSNLFDLAIVFIDLFMTVVDSVTAANLHVGPLSVCRALRILRILRVVRNFAAFRDLYLMINGMVGALRAIVFAFVLICVAITMFSIAAVEVVHPINQRLIAEGVHDDCASCKDAFASVSDASLTFFSIIVAGDGWANLALPLINASPLSAFILLACFVFLQLGLLNVIIAVVVDRQAQARQEDQDLQCKMKQERAEIAFKELRGLFEEMDSGGDGFLDFDEICRAYVTSERFRRILESVDIYSNDLVTIFSCMDSDGTGFVDYDEFVNGLHFMRAMEVRSLLFLTRQHIIDVKESLLSLFEHVGAPLPSHNKLKDSTCLTWLSRLSASATSEDGDHQAYPGDGKYCNESNSSEAASRRKEAISTRIEATARRSEAIFSNQGSGCFSSEVATNHDKWIAALESKTAASLEAAKFFEAQVRLDTKLEDIVQLLRAQCGKATVATSAPSPASSPQACRVKLTDAHEVHQTPDVSDQHALSIRKNFVEAPQPSSAAKHLVPIPEERCC